MNIIEGIRRNDMFRALGVGLVACLTCATPRRGFSLEEDGFVNTRALDPCFMCVCWLCSLI
jgi:hypothetical protein